MPVALVPLWHCAQGPGATFAWSKRAGVHATVEWQALGEPGLAAATVGAERRLLGTLDPSPARLKALVARYTPRVVEKITGIEAGKLAQAFAQSVPARVSFTANLKDASGPVTGSHVFVFTVYDAATGGTSTSFSRSATCLPDASSSAVSISVSGMLKSVMTIATSSAAK